MCSEVLSVLKSSKCGSSQMLRQHCLRLFTNSSNWMHSLGLLFRRYVFNSESDVVKCHTQEFLLLLCLQLTEVERAWADLSLHGSNCEHLATHENSTWDNTVDFSGDKSAPKALQFWPLYCRLSFTGSSMQRCTESREIPNLPQSPPAANAGANKTLEGRVSNYKEMKVAKRRRAEGYI